MIALTVAFSTPATWEDKSLRRSVLSQRRHPLSFTQMARRTYQRSRHRKRLHQSSLRCLSSVLLVHGFAQMPVYFHREVPRHFHHLWLQHRQLHRISPLLALVKVLSAPLRLAKRTFICRTAKEHRRYLVCGLRHRPRSLLKTKSHVVQVLDRRTGSRLAYLLSTPGIHSNQEGALQQRMTHRPLRRLSRRRSNRYLSPRLVALHWLSHR